MAGSLRLVASTFRWRFESFRSFLGETPQPVILALWHGKQALVATGLERYGRRGGLPLFGELFALASAHGDGRRAAAVLEGLGIRNVTGSSTRGAVQAMRTMLRLLDAGHNVAVTVDGPRGPAGVAKPGVVGLARASGRPVLPISAEATRTVTLGTWDGFELPVPFGIAALGVGPAVRVPRDSGQASADHYLREVEAGIRAAAGDARRLVATRPADESAAVRGTNS